MGSALVWGGVAYCVSGRLLVGHARPFYWGHDEATMIIVVTLGFVIHLFERRADAH